MLENNNKNQPEEGKTEETKVEVRAFKKVSKFSVFVYKRFRLIILLEVLLILIVGYLFIIRVELSEIGNYDKLVLRKQKELEKIKEYKNNSLEFEKQYNIIRKDVEKDVNRLYDILPPREDLPNIMAQIEALVNTHGFMLGSIDMSLEKEGDISGNELPLINLEETEKTNLIKEVEINIFVFTEEGGYERIKELLDAFEHHVRFTDIVSFSFEEDMNTYSIILKTYYLNYEE